MRNLALAFPEKKVRLNRARILRRASSPWDDNWPNFAAFPNTHCKTSIRLVLVLGWIENYERAVARGKGVLSFAGTSADGNYRLSRFH